MVVECLCLCRSKHKESGFSLSAPTVIQELCHQFSLADLRKSTNNFDKNRIIGRGIEQMTLYKGRLQHNVATHCTVVMKRMWGLDEWALEMFKKEIELLCQLRHPNLVSLIGFCNHKDEKIIVYEYMPNGSLYDHLHRSEMEALSWKKRLEICIGAARGVHYLHTGTKRTIIHRNIKPSNILLDSNMVPKISDFWVCLQGQLFSEKPKPIEPEFQAGTVGHLAPENLSEVGLTDRSDVYSFGVVLMEVICGKSFDEIATDEHAREEIETTDGSEMRDDTGMSTFIYRLRSGQVIDPILAGKIAPDCLELYVDIIVNCMQHEPNERPAMGEVEVELEHVLTLQQETDARNSGGD